MMKKKQPQWLTAKLRKRVIVYLVEDSPMDGLLVDVSEEGLELMDVTMREASDVPLKGSVFVARDKIRFVQVV